jgi:tetratricopeptide (TPR) repeat protein
MGRLRITKKHRAESQSTQKGPIAVDPRTLEKSIAEIHRLMEEREFKSLDDANAFLQGMVSSGKPLQSSPRTPLENAQDVMYKAWDASGKSRAELARKALGISADCADAYVLLAEETARSLEEAQKLYEQGMKAGERALGPRAFKEGIGHFWAILETRPYMRARFGLAQSLWARGEKKEAIEHCSEMLRLNPNDNQGIRYFLAQCLVEEGEDKNLERLLDQYPGDCAASWLYTRALWAFRREGESKRANRFLKEALKVNRFVPAYLLGNKKLPNRLPPYIGLGDDSEAVEYAAEVVVLWRKTEGALAWLKRQLP